MLGAKGMQPFGDKSMNGVSVRLPDRETMERLDKAFAAVPGLKMCL